jgi:gamma-glutamylcyclotransferase (GGCT)/AIG2-like uncharacterized protein YtfP
MDASAKINGELQGYSLVFNQPGIPLFEPAFANIRPQRGESVHGVLWEITREDLGRLDLQEGGGNAYDRLVVQVDTDEGPVEARTYVATRNVSGIRPSRRYLDVLLEGAREAALPGAYIDKLARVPVLDIPGLRFLTPPLMKFFERLFERGIDPKKIFDLWWRWRRDR